MNNQQRTAVIVFSRSDATSGKSIPVTNLASTSLTQYVALPVSPSSSPVTPQRVIQVPYISSALTITPCRSDPFLDPLIISNGYQHVPRVEMTDTPSSPILDVSHLTPLDLSHQSPRSQVECPSSPPSMPEFERSDASLDPLSDHRESRSRDSSVKRGRPRLDDIMTLQNPIATPSNIRCTFCHRTFPREKSLQAHLRTHTGERPYACDYPGCGRAFAQSGQLRTHQRLHTGEKPFICAADGCNMRFTHANRICSIHPKVGIKRDKSTPRNPESILQVNSSLSNDVNRSRGRKRSLSTNTNCARLRTRKLMQELDAVDDANISAGTSHTISSGDENFDASSTIWKKKKAAIELHKKQQESKPVETSQTTDVSKDQLMGALALIELSRSSNPVAVLSMSN